MKEYYKDSGLLLFEGEYINGKKWNGKSYNKEGKREFEIKNGKGKVKEYIFSWLIFEGDYLNGEKNGKGKEFNSDNKIIFDGEYLKGKKRKRKAI